ncbi:DASH complex subunit dam1 [Ophidiomyces ophidiicola]|uniref:DASH complex subunit dam1 n=1 Tax=Ophidiomyces ophidiicola TaxID=1387563 RepID=A0ACB8V1L9_9EURO|nr:DASH complex subunit dam1 [Ophidiomyces ophidiicola]KAI1912529.1 DASH complex subunit dam1 [Ophidiomyces ophidiicola]KAI1914669.1 DASH complex subunit dam1 [Ophidiomyces ophidiicola]KAI1930893.1 DASH complex subunit dam1 [Ophidiomyces ophidiicola]KAI1946797.1 DASH complex subunit dam1 [Ophidiomyces ophidiicola]KAI1962140.1 DASH complex subunit dam1 [Ophidiomyces ophidiicola]
MDPSHRQSRPQPSSRPTTPLRPSSRSSLREQTFGGGSARGHALQPAVNTLEPQFAELSDSMADLEANFMHLQLLHESLSRFSESFASFLYGLNMNAFCVDFPEAPVQDSFRRANEAAESATLAPEPCQPDVETETTFMTTDTSFIDHPPTSSKRSSKFASSGLLRTRSTESSRGTARGRHTARGTTGRQRASGLARPRGRGIR